MSDFERPQAIDHLSKLKVILQEKRERKTYQGSFNATYGAYYVKSDVIGHEIDKLIDRLHKEHVSSKESVIDRFLRRLKIPD